MYDDEKAYKLTATDPNPPVDDPDEAEPLEDDHYPDDDEYEEISEDEL